MPNSLEEIAGTVGVTVGELIFAVLREGAIGSAVLALIAFFLSRFTTEIYGRALRSGAALESPIKRQA
jgi:hypothetical protein